MRAKIILFILGAFLASLFYFVRFEPKNSKIPANPNPKIERKRPKLVRKIFPRILDLPGMKSSKKEPNPTVKSKSTKDKPAFAIGDSFGIGAYTYRGGVIPIVDFRVLRLYQLGILVGIGYSQRTEEIVFPFVGVAYLFKSKYLSNSSVVIGLANERFSVGFRLSF